MHELEAFNTHILEFCGFILLCARLYKALFASAWYPFILVSVAFDLAAVLNAETSIRCRRLYLRLQDLSRGTRIEYIHKDTGFGGKLHHFASKLKIVSLSSLYTCLIKCQTCAYDCVPCFPIFLPIFFLFILDILQPLLDPLAVYM